MVIQQKMEAKHVKARDINLRKDDFEGETGHGYTEVGCQRCRWAIDFTWEAETTLSHSSECRRRLRELIRQSGPEGRRRVDAADKRRDEWLAKQVEDNVQAEGETLPRAADEQPDVEEEVPAFQVLADATLEDDERALRPGCEDPDLFGDVTPRASPSYSPSSPATMDVEEHVASMAGPLGDGQFRAVKIPPVSAPRDAEPARPQSPDEYFLAKLARDLAGDERFVLSELYSPPRVTHAAGVLKNMGITPGFALDLTAVDEKGAPWDF